MQADSDGFLALKKFQQDIHTASSITTLQDITTHYLQSELAV